MTDKSTTEQELRRVFASIEVEGGSVMLTGKFACCVRDLAMRGLTLAADLDAANVRNARLTAALNDIASWTEGSFVTSSFDEPASAEIARAALAAEEGR